MIARRRGQLDEAGNTSMPPGDALGRGRCRYLRALLQVGRGYLADQRGDVDRGARVPAAASGIDRTTPDTSWYRLRTRGVRRCVCTCCRRRRSEARGPAPGSCGSLRRDGGALDACRRTIRSRSGRGPVAGGTRRRLRHRVRFRNGCGHLHCDRGSERRTVDRLSREPIEVSGRSAPVSRRRVCGQRHVVGCRWTADERRRPSTRRSSQCPTTCTAGGGLPPGTRGG